MDPLDSTKTIAPAEAAAKAGAPPFAPGIKTIAGALLLFLWIAWYSLLPAWPLESIGIFLLGMIYAGILVILFLIRCRKVGNTDGTMSASHLIRWSVIWVLGVLAIVLMNGWGRHIGFDLSRADMDRLVQRARSSPKQYLELHQRVGIYRVSRISCGQDTLGHFEDNWICEIVLTDADDDHGGFYYAPKPTMFENYPGTMALGGGWFTWRHYPT